MTDIVYNKNGVPFDIDAIATDLNGKMDTDGTNADPSESFINMFMPDYASATLVSSPFTAQTNGFIRFSGSAYSAGNASDLFIDGVSVCGINTAIATFTIPIAKGSTATITNAGSGSGQMYFVPLKGVS